MPLIPCGDGSEMVCRTRLGDQGRIGPSRWTACWGPWPPGPWQPSTPQPSPAQPSPRPPRLCHPASRCGIPDGCRWRLTTDGIRPDRGGVDGQGSGPVLQRTKPPSLGSHAPCSSLPLGVSRSLAIMMPASRPSVCWMGECRDGAVTAVHGQPPAGNVNATCAVLSRHCRGSGWSP